MKKFTRAAKKSENVFNAMCTIKDAKLNICIEKTKT